MKRKYLTVESTTHYLVGTVSHRLGISYQKVVDRVLEKALTEKPLTVAKASSIFRAMNGDKDAQSLVTMDEVTGYLPCETFYEFLQVNNIFLVDEQEHR